MKPETGAPGEDSEAIGEPVWLVHKGGFAAAHLLKPESGTELGEGKCRVRVDQSGDVLEVDEEDIEKVGVDGLVIVLSIAILLFMLIKLVTIKEL